MSTFFHGWRRKMGVMTLALALLSMRVWMRSFEFCDEVNLWIEDALLVWTPDQLTFVCAWPMHSPNDFRGKNWSSFNVREYVPNYIEIVHEPWIRPGLAGFDLAVGRNSVGNKRMAVCSIPYWSIVIPLTLLSAWLLLSKPRSPKQHAPPPPEPDHA